MKGNAGWILLALGAWWLMSKKQPAAGGNTGVSKITGGGGPLLPCYDQYGNIVDAGNSQFCPPGTFVTPPPGGWGGTITGVTCLDDTGAPYTIPMGPCPPGSALPPPPPMPPLMPYGSGPQGLAIDSGLGAYWGTANRL